MIAVAAIVLTGLMAVVGGLVLLFGRRGERPIDPERDRSDRWARPQDVRPLAVVGNPQGRVVLGRLGPKTLIGAPERRSVAVIAPTGTGKTARFVVPALLRWDGAAVVTSVKGDALALSIAERRRRGPVWVFDPTGVTGEKSCTWSPLLGVATFADALTAATWLVEAGSASARTDDDASLWETLGKDLLAPLLFAAARRGYELDAVVEWVAIQDEEHVTELLRDLDDRDALNKWEATKTRHHRTKSSIYTTAGAILSAFAHPSIRDAVQLSEPERVMDPARLLSEGGTLYLVAPATDQAEFRPVFEALVNAVVRAAERRSAESGGLPINPRLLLMLDEAANIAPLRRLGAIASAGAGQGIVLVSVWQDASQVTSVYGPTEATTVLANHTCKVWLPGITDYETLRRLSELLGEHTITRTTKSTDHHGRSSVTEARQTQQLAPPEYLRQLRPGTAVVLVDRMKPMQLHTAGWWEDAELRGRVDAATAERFDAEFNGGAARSRA